MLPLCCSLFLMASTRLHPNLLCRASPGRRERERERERERYIYRERSYGESNGMDKLGNDGCLPFTLVVWFIRLELKRWEGDDQDVPCRLLSPPSGRPHHFTARCTVAVRSAAMHLPLIPAKVTMELEPNKGWPR
jgi:hypothetical protein